MAKNGPYLHDILNTYDLWLYGCYGDKGYRVLGKNLTFDQVNSLKEKQKKHGMKANEYMVAFPVRLN